MAERKLTWGYVEMNKQELLKNIEHHSYSTQHRGMGERYLQFLITCVTPSVKWSEDAFG